MNPVPLADEPADIDQMMTYGGLLLVPHASATCAMGHLVNHAEFGNFGPVWICAANGAVPDYLERSVWPREMVTEKLARYFLRQPERICAYLSLDAPAAAVLMATREGVGAILLDGMPSGDDGLATAILKAVTDGCLVVLATDDPGQLSGDGLPVCDPNGHFIPPSGMTAWFNRAEDGARG